MSKHTPGPWEAQISDVSSPYVTARRNGDDIGIDCIASVNQQLHDVAEANARLIAAAPEMLKFIERCQAWFTHNGVVAIRNEARELIAKAGGRS